MGVLTHPDARRLIRSERATAMVFEDQHSKELLDRLQQIAPSDAGVLIIGETGTGKELVARQIHQLGHRRNKPFVAVNCGAFSESLVESELFGHEKGSFTGAVDSRAGWFEAADGGTIFLDEIGDLSLAIQVKLLRVLQESEVTRLGSRHPKKLSIRVIAATNVQLEEAVRAGKFREDLYYRLKVAAVQLLPLRLRPADIIPLANYFIADYSERLGYEPAQLSASTEQFLTSYHWPGNIRELENAIHHALLVCKAQEIKPGDFQLSGLSAQAAHTFDAGYAAAGVGKSSLQQVLLNWFEDGIENLDEQLEAEIIQAAYQYCHQNQLHTARLLGISRNIVRARLIKHGLLNPSHRPRHNPLNSKDERHAFTANLYA